MKKIAYILAGGMGSRFECNVPKQFVKIDQKMLLEYTMDIFQQHELSGAERIYDFIIA